MENFNKSDHSNFEIVRNYYSQLKCSNYLKLYEL